MRKIGNRSTQIRMKRTYINAHTGSKCAIYISQALSFQIRTWNYFILKHLHKLRIVKHVFVYFPPFGSFFLDTPKKGADVLR